MYIHEPRHRVLHHSASKHKNSDTCLIVNFPPCVQPFVNRVNPVCALSINLCFLYFGCDRCEGMLTHLQNSWPNSSFWDDGWTTRLWYSDSCRGSLRVARRYAVNVVNCLNVGTWNVPCMAKYIISVFTFCSTRCAFCQVSTIMFNFDDY